MNTGVWTSWGNDERGRPTLTIAMVGWWLPLPRRKAALAEMLGLLPFFPHFPAQIAVRKWFTFVFLFQPNRCEQDFLFVDLIVFKSLSKEFFPFVGGPGVLPGSWLPDASDQCYTSFSMLIVSCVEAKPPRVSRVRINLKWLTRICRGEFVNFVLFSGLPFKQFVHWLISCLECRRWDPNESQVTPKWIPNDPQMIPKWPPNESHMNPKWLPNESHMSPKWFPNDPQHDPNIIPKWSQQNPKTIPKSSQQHTKLIPTSFQNYLKNQPNVIAKSSQTHPELIQQ